MLFAFCLCYTCNSNKSTKFLLKKKEENVNLARSVTHGGKMYQQTSRKNKTNIFVRECITQSLFKLLEKKDFECISITDIITKAGVSRMGFYRNYSSKEDVIESYILDLFVQTVDEIQRERALSFKVKNIMVTTLETFKKYSDQIKLFLDRNLDWLLFRCYSKAFDFLAQNKKPSRVREYSNQLFVGELFNFEMSWLRNGMKETPEQMARIYYYILQRRLNIKNFI